MDDIKDIDIDDEKLNQSEATTSLYEELNPSEVYFSQCCVSEMKVFDQSLYVPIIVAKYHDHYTSYDNRRLLSARNVLKSNEDFRIRCEVQWWSTPMSMDRDEVSAGWFDYYFTISVNNAGDATKGVYVIGCTPRTFGTLVALRCARQGHDFSLTGQHHEPCVKSFDRDSDYSLKGNREFQSVSNEDAWNVFVQALTDKDTILCVSYQENGQRFCHDDLKDFFRDDCRNSLHFFRCEYYPNKWLKARANFDEDDWNRDRKARNYEIEYENEIRRLRKEYYEDCRKLSEQECVSSELILPVERLMITETRNVTRAVRNAKNNY